MDTSPPTSPSRPPCLLEKASWWSLLTFSWVYPVLETGIRNKDIREVDLPELPPAETSQYNASIFDILWQRELAKKDENQQPNLQRALLFHALKKLWFVQPMMLCMSAARIGQALALGKMIRFFQGNETAAEGYIYATVMVICGLLLLFLNHHTFYHTWNTGSQIRIATIAAIYAKTLRLSSISTTSKTDDDYSGQVLNLASNDVERFLFSTIFLSHLFWGPLEAIAVLVVGLIQVGPAFLAGYGLLFIFIPTQMYLGILFVRYRSKIAVWTDQRVTLVKQAISGIRVVKMMGWEYAFLKQIQALRQQEAAHIQQATRLKAWNEAIFFATNAVVAAVIFIVHVLLGNELKAEHVFTTFTLINVVQLTMTKFFSFGVMSVSEVTVSIKRVQAFLQRPEPHEINSANVFAADELRENPKLILRLENVTCHWRIPDEDDDVQTSNVEQAPTSSYSIALQDVCLRLERGKLNCILGSVGSGKSALLQAICGELVMSSGRKLVCKPNLTIGYAAQDPFVMDGSLRENVLFGLDYDALWYDWVIAACGLHFDLGQFVHGDQTIVGDRGVTCSGGQRARIGLARAMYRKADLLVLDDPISAVDAKVGKSIMESLRSLCDSQDGPCVVLATHQRQYIRQDDVCVLMVNGRVESTGTYEKCIGKVPEIAFAPVASVEEHDDMVGSDATQVPNGRNEASEEQSKKGLEEGKPVKHLEEKNTGVVEWRTWTAYISSMGGVPIALILFLLYGMSQASVLVAIAEVGKWAEQSVEEQDSVQSLTLIAGLALGVTVLSIARALSVFFFAVKASQNLHDKMTFSVLRAKISFFDTNPIGRIMNRFSADVGSNDDLLPMTLYDFFMCAFMVLGAVVTAGSILPYMLIVIPFLTIYFVHLRKIFVTTSRELKRLEALARSPIFATISESLGGIATIRSNGAVDYYRKRFENVHDAHSRAFFIFIASSRWLGFRMDSLVFILLVVASYLSVLFQDQGWFSVDPALFGLALTLLLMLAGLFQWTIRQSAETVNQMVSVERVSAFSRLEPEAPLETSFDNQHPKWPTNGQLICSNLRVRYRDDLPPSLINVSFSIRAGERVGVVGRTGSGKSTLLQSLLRLLEAEEGEIAVDGVDISKLGLHKLRHSVSVIPQSPVLFSGSTVRQNIDPFNQYSDQALEQALEDVQMLAVVTRLAGGIHALVAENGSNFSVGQRQLLCLARAILRQTRILILDEASANVDKDTDRLLQATVSKKFADATIISVAHRLDTVINYDKILVLGVGMVLEFDSPKNLISAGGYFASMVEDTGGSGAEELRRRASSDKLPLKDI